MNLFFIALVCLISWYQLIHSEEYKNYSESMMKIKNYDLQFDDGK